MIIFANRPESVKVMRTNNGGQGVTNIGTLRRADKFTGWIWDKAGISWLNYGTVDHSEKQSLIGLIDKLNGVPYRAQETLLERWREISDLTEDNEAELENYTGRSWAECGRADN